MFITGLEIFRINKKRGKYKCEKCHKDFDTYKPKVSKKEIQKRCPYCNALLETIIIHPK